MFSRLHLDLTPMRSRPFTLLLLSRTITRIGSIITSTTILLHAAHLTESPFATGSVAAAQLLPILVLGLCGLTAALLGLGALGTIYGFRAALTIGGRGHHGLAGPTVPNFPKPEILPTT